MRIDQQASEEQSRAPLPRMTRYGSDSFEEFFAHELRALGKDCLDAAGSKLLAVILGGGYGRGEGAILSEGNREMAYNDLDLFLVFDAPMRKVPACLEPVRHAWENRLGVEVDFSRPLSPSSIRRWPNALMWHDLMLGHMVLAGPEEALSKHCPQRVFEHPAPIEALRLLLNRGAGLAWAREVHAGASAAPDTDFIRRNIMKANLAAGDAVLLTHQLHHHQVAERSQRLVKLAKHDAKVSALGITEAHHTAARFKSDPSSQPATLTQIELDAARNAWQAALLYCESKRMGRTFESLEDYLADTSLREPERHTAPQRLANLARSIREKRWSTIYPREALYREVAQLLASPLDVNATQQMLAVWRKVA